MDGTADEAAEALRTTSATGLLRAYASLTHQIRGANGQAEEEARDKRDAVAAEILSRMGSTPLGRPPEGAKVKVVDCQFGHGFKIGETVTLVRHDASSDGAKFTNVDQSWWLCWDEIEPVR